MCVCARVCVCVCVLASVCVHARTLVADCLRSISLSLEWVKIKQRHQIFQRYNKSIDIFLFVFACLFFGGFFEEEGGWVIAGLQIRNRNHFQL